MSTEDINKEEYDICVKCGKTTSYKMTDNIIYSSGYIEGAGQLCFVCSHSYDSLFQNGLDIAN